MELFIFILVGWAFFKRVAIVSLFKKSDAASAVQKLLEHQASAGLFSDDPIAAARKYIDDAWQDKPQVFNGYSGHRPHKLSVVAYALALATKKMQHSHDRNFEGIMNALDMALLEVHMNGHRYPLTSADNLPISEAEEMFSEAKSSFITKRQEAAREVN